MTTQKIVSRYSSATVLFECELPEGLKSGLAMRHALEKATKAKADLSGAYLRDADLGDADLHGADLHGADLRGADLRGADLRGAYLRGADLGGAEAATPEKSIENLDKVRAIVMDNRARLEMGHWHEDDAWKERTCAEETLCETTHCLAGWLQVCSTEEAVRNERDPQLAGIKAAPIAAKMFFRQPEEVFSWLEDRKYVGDIAERERRAAERAAQKAEGGAA